MAEAAVLHGLAGTEACRRACAWLVRCGHAYRFVDTRRERPAPEALKAWAQAAGGWDALVDRSGRAWKNLLPQRRNPESDPEWMLLIREHPGVLRQPLAVLPDGTLLVGFTGGQYEKRFGKGRATA
ncbi:ArsC/Spx/MgsR family protein [Dyella sp. KRB-257]|uniref:ArsC/Spx/MgsR family protein n=1 Tax=Dyella sp. KRB-257 TaxID=3400915 RepID=UPI003C0543F3